MEFLDPLIDFLGERRGLWGKYNWQYVFAFFLGLSAMLAAREYTKKMRRLKDSQRNDLAHKTLSALIIATENECEVRYSARLLGSESGFRVAITKGDEPNIEKVVDQDFLTLDEVESFLRDNTKFLLPDFQ